MICLKFSLKNFDLPVIVSRIAYIHYFEFTDKYHTEYDSHDFCEFVYVDKGKLYVKSDNFTGQLCEGECIIHTPNEMHSFECISKCAPNLIIIGFECKNKEISELSNASVMLSDDKKRILADIIKEGMSVYAPPYDVPNTIDMRKRKEYPFGADQMIKLKLEELLILLVRGIHAAEVEKEQALLYEPDVFDVHQYIKEHYCEKITLANLCFIFGTNKTTLCKGFKEKYGTTVLGYINGLRIREAKSMLREGDFSVTEISEKLGFSSVHYFCRVFKKLTGRTPNEYTRGIRSKFE